MGYSAYQIYGLLTNGNSSSLWEASNVTAGQIDTQRHISNQVQNLTQRMNAAWQGGASDLAQAGANPLTQAAQSAADALNTHQGALMSQASAFDTANKSVVPVSPSAPQNNFMNQVQTAFGANTPLDQQISQYNSDSQTNIQVYNQYNGATNTNVAQMPSEYGQIPVMNANISVVNPTSVGPGGPGYGYTGSGVTGGGGAPTYGSSSYAGPSYSGGTYAGPGGGGGAPVGAAPGAGSAGSGGPTWTGPTQVSSASGMAPTTPGEAIPGGGMGYPGGAGVSTAGDPFLLGGPGSRNASGALAAEQGALGGRFGAGGLAGAGGSGGAGIGGSGSGVAGGEGTASGGGQGAHSGAGSNMTEEALGRGTAGGLPGEGRGAGGMGGGMGGARGGQGEEDEEHQTADYLQEPDPDAIFGTDTPTVPPVIGL
jgi:hypothetical protein